MTPIPSPKKITKEEKELSFDELLDLKEQFVILKLPGHFKTYLAMFYSNKLNDLIKENKHFNSIEKINRELLDPLDELHGVETYRFTESRHETTLNIRCKYKNCNFHLKYNFEVN